jgi:hypothetical protein
MNITISGRCRNFQFTMEIKADTFLNKIKVRCWIQGETVTQDIKVSTSGNHQLTCYINYGSLMDRTLWPHQSPHQ